MRWDQDSQSWVRVGATNKAAKFKAVRKENTWGGKGDWWMADGKCGLGIQVYDDLADFVDAIITACKSGTAIDFNAAPLPWIYNPPRGDDAPGDIEPFRVLDFDHYNRNAVFTKPRLQTDKELTIDNAGDIDDNNLYTVDFPGDVTYPDGRTLASESLGLGDIRPTGSDAPLSSYYFGIILVDCGNLSSWVVGTDDTSLGNFISGWTGMTIEGARQLSGAVANKEIAMIPFLSSVEVHGFWSDKGLGTSFRICGPRDPPDREVVVRIDNGRRPLGGHRHRGNQRSDGDGRHNAHQCTGRDPEAQERHLGRCGWRRLHGSLGRPLTGHGYLPLWDGSSAA